MLRLQPFFGIVLAAAGAVFAQDDGHPTLDLGSPAPDFSLRGIDGKTHQLSDYSAAGVLAIVFTCNHCLSSTEAN